MPNGFNHKGDNGSNKLFKLKRTIYFFIQGPRDFWKYISVKLESFELFKLKLYPFLFVRDKFICILYVYDMFLWSKYDKYIHNLDLK